VLLPIHFEALGQMANFLGILQSEWAGAQAFSSFDTYLAPYVFKDNLSFDEVLKAVRSFVYNLNVPARWGQSPFTNITLDWVVPDDLKEQIPTRNDHHLFENIVDEKLIHIAKERGVTTLTAMRYEHFQKEMNLINKAYYTVMTEGDANGQPFTFPIPTVNITEDFDWNGENTELLFENTAKIGSSYFQNFIGSQYILDHDGQRVENPNAYKPNAVRSMCCRLQLDLRELLKRGNGLFGSAEMTGSIGVVTINMARLGYLYENDEEALYVALDRLLVISKDTLEKKRQFIQELYDRGLFPYTKRYLLHFRNHFSTIGVNGMNEMIRNFTSDKEDITTTFGFEFSMKILDHIRNRMKEFQEATGNLYNLEATPAEGTTYRFAKEDKKRFPEILQAGMDENIYYTNSSQIPVDFTQDPFEALMIQDQLQCQYTGGTVLHLYMNERISSAEACKNFVKTVLTKFKLPYITITPVFSVCPVHGYLNGEHEYCPKCDENLIENLNNKTYENKN
jgi:ribonucleoside-triphosphate reductase